MSAFDRVKKIVVEQLGVNEADVQIDASYITGQILQVDGGMVM